MSRTSTLGESSIDGAPGSLWARVTTLWRTKLALLVVLTAGFCATYIYLAHHAFFPVRDLPLLWIDRVAGFDPRWVWVYQSVYLLTGTLPWLATTREQLRRYVIGFLLLTSVCFTIYLFFPTHVPRPVVEAPGGMYWLLLTYDGPYNALPSLHAGFLYYTLRFARRVYGRPAWHVSVVILIWSAVILWATLATKEHYAVDLLVGIALAAVCDWAAWRSRPRSDRSNPPSVG